MRPSYIIIAIIAVLVLAPGLIGTIIGGIFSLLTHFLSLAVPVLLIYWLYTRIRKSSRRRK